jgi:hypothetical protein
MEIVVILVLITVLILLLFAGGLLSKKTTHSERLEIVDVIGQKSSRICPLCGHGLGKGETLKTRVIELPNNLMRVQGGYARENMAQVLGCPYCWPASQGNPRTCPSCKSVLDATQTVAARYFEREGTDTQGQKKRNHLHILGCPHCRPQGIS